MRNAFLTLLLLGACVAAKPPSTAPIVPRPRLFAPLPVEPPEPASRALRQAERTAYRYVLGHEADPDVIAGIRERESAARSAQDRQDPVEVHRAVEEFRRYLDEQGIHPE